MKYGRLEDGSRVSADIASKTNKHFCPGCGAALILKQGEINDWHFAHENGAECDAFTENKMSEWHIKHQNEFPEECREVRLEKDGVVHIADIMIDGCIIEFQHSQMDNETFEERSVFYSNFGQLIWVFDLRDKWKTDKIQWIQKTVGSDYGYFEWKNASKMLGMYDFAKSNVKLFAELDDTGWGCLVSWNPNRMRFFSGKRFDHQQFMKHVDESRKPAPLEHRQMYADILSTNKAVLEEREEAIKRAEAEKRLAELEARRKMEQYNASKKIDVLTPKIRQLEIDREWAKRTYDSIGEELRAMQTELNQAKRVVGWQP